MMDTEVIRQRLLKEKDELLRRVGQLDGELNRSEPVSADFAEQVVEQENLEVVRALDQEGKAELKNIQRALLRLDNDEYGVCVSCGGDISEERLQALPAADRCIRCAQQG